MLRCACRKRSGVRCQNAALEGSRFCGVHRTCRRVAAEGAPAPTDVRDAARSIRATLEELQHQMRSLEEERDFYYAKLEAIERLTQDDASPLAARVRRQLFRSEA